MAVRASTRLSIRWPPAEASEPTDTLVLSIGDCYVDLRVAKEDQSIDWGLAGKMIVLSEDPLKIEFTHPFDSHYVAGQQEGAPDIGEFTRLSNGDDLETGVMAAPHLDNKILPYEEIWRELDPGLGESNVAWILESVDDGNGNVTTKSHYARVGKYFLALRQTDSKEPLSRTYSAIRQDLNAKEGTWTTTYEIGNVEGMFSLVGGEADATAEGWKVGDKVTVGPLKESCVVRAVGP